jgi:hypothetical protein
MKAEPKTKWIAELRSGKHKQCAQVLHSGDAYCAFGVLLYEAVKLTPYDWRRMLIGAYDLPEKEIDAIAEMNDSGLSFREIADYIEANL